MQRDGGVNVHVRLYNMRCRLREPINKPTMCVRIASVLLVAVPFAHAFEVHNFVFLFFEQRGKKGQKGGRTDS